MKIIYTFAARFTHANYCCTRIHVSMNLIGMQEIHVPYFNASFFYCYSILENLNFKYHSMHKVRFCHSRKMHIAHG